MSCHWFAASLWGAFYINLFCDFIYIRSITRGPSTNSQWIYDSPVNSEVESKLRSLLLEMGSEKILGIQVGRLIYML